ncbi:MAG: alpha/beta hydrolase [Aristaeellaceae bacterium]
MGKRPDVDFSAPACQPFFLQGDGHAVLLMHGFTGSAGHMRPLGEALHAQGFTVQGINLPGHATTMEDMGRTTWQDWLQASKEACVALKDRYEHVSVAGLSMGGVLTLLLAEQMELTAAAPISAPMAVQNRFMPLARYAAPFMPMVWWRGSGERAAMVDSRYDFGYPGFPTRCAADLSTLIHMARRNLHAVTCPLLAVQSHADETISRDSADVIVSGVSSQTRGILWLEEVPHVCTLSRELPTIASALGETFRQAEHP